MNRNRLRHEPGFGIQTLASSHFPRKCSRAKISAWVKRSSESTTHTQVSVATPKRDITHSTNTR